MIIEIKTEEGVYEVSNTHQLFLWLVRDRKLPRDEARKEFELLYVQDHDEYNEFEATEDDFMDELPDTYYGGE